MNGWEVRQGTYFQDVIATKYDGGMDARFEWSENEDAVFSGITTADHSKNSRASCLIVSLTRLIVKKKKDMYSLEEAMWNCRRSFHFLWAALLTGIQHLHEQFIVILIKNVC